MLRYNYFVAYDLMFPGQNYDAVIKRITSLGDYAHMQLSLFYLQTDLALADVHRLVREVMDANDKLAVIWANDAFISNYQPAHLEMLSRTFTQAMLPAA